jgi:hypothetical protein
VLLAACLGGLAAPAWPQAHTASAADLGTTTSWGPWTPTAPTLADDAGPWLDRTPRLQRPQLSQAATAPADPPAAEPPPTGYRWRGMPPAEPDYPGARRDAWYFLSYQIVGVGVLYALPESVSGWTAQDKKEFGFDEWYYNVTHPTLDSDTFVVNYVLHPYWGAAYYVRGRERGLDRTESFWYSTLMSMLWEYGAEAIAEQVSLQDLVVTPVLGSLLGEFVFQPLRDRIRAKPGELDFYDRSVLALTDPLGAINAKVDSWFGAYGAKSSLQFVPGGPRPVPPRAAGTASVGPTAAPVAKAYAPWRLQLRVDW